MTASPYSNISFKITPDIRAFLKRYVNDVAVPPDINSKLKNLDLQADCISFSLLECLHAHVSSGIDNVIPLWKLLRNSELRLPKPSSPARSPALQKSVETLKKKLENDEYTRMTHGFTPLGRTGTSRFSLCDELKCLNRQMIMVINFLCVVVGSFVFGYFVCDMFGQSNVSFFQRTILGLSFAMVVFFADLYFVIKNVDTMDKPNLIPVGKPFVT